MKRRLLREDGTLGHPYYRDLKESSRGPGRSISFPDLVERCAAETLVFLGDFHADPECQRFAAKLLAALATRTRGLGLGVEFVPTRQQRALDRRQRGEMSDEDFLRRIHYRGDWGYPWEGYKELLDTARDLGVPAFALDRSPRGGVRGLGRRDEHAARRIREILRSGGATRLLVFFGESHVSPGRLPKRAAARTTTGAGESSPSSIVVLQDPEEAYWWFLESSEGAPPVAELEGGCLAVFHTSPLERYERYRQVMERWQGDASPGEDADLTPAVHHVIDGIARWIGIRPDRKRVRHLAGWNEALRDAYPEVYSGAEAARLLASILGEHGRSDDEIREAERHFDERGALYEPRSNTFFLRKYLPGPAAGESAKFLRTALCGRLFRGPEDAHPDPAERAYGQVLNEAIAYLGARLLDPASEIVTPRGDEDDEPSRRDWLARHREFEASGASRLPDGLVDALRESRPLRRRLARDLGHRLGATLFERVGSGRMGRRALRSLFTRVLDPPQARRAVIRLLRAESR